MKKLFIAAAFIVIGAGCTSEVARTPAPPEVASTAEKASPCASVPDDAKIIKSPVAGSSWFAFVIPQSDETFTQKKLVVCYQSDPSTLFERGPRCSWGHGDLGDVAWTKNGSAIMYQDICGGELEPSRDEVLFVRLRRNTDWIPEACLTRSLSECEKRLEFYRQ